MCPHKPEKERRVCNTAAKNKRESLTDKLSTGSDFLQNLNGNIFGFKKHQIALTAHVVAMFLRAKVQSQECRVSRFSWGSRPEDKIGFYEYTRHVFGAKSSPTCANCALLQAGVDNKESHAIPTNVIEGNFYMDDFAKFVATVEEVVHVYQDVRTTLQNGGFNMLKWICRSEGVTRSVPEMRDQRQNAKQSKKSLTPRHFRACNRIWKTTI